MYATGWCAHDAKGVIAESQQQAMAVIDELTKDWKEGRIKPKNQPESGQELLDKRKVPYVTWSDWLVLFI